MLKRKVPKFFFVIIITIWNFGTSFSQTSLVPQIINPNSQPLQYCSDSILVAEEITINNITINEASEGMKISVVNYKPNEDILVYDAVSNLNYRWDNNHGHLEIKGVGTAAEYQTAIRKVYYKNIANVPNLDSRTFTISLLDADYLPSTEHFYRFVKKMDITWKEAKLAADNLNYYGLQGYLTTITSSVENDFIWTKTDGVGWIGASDEGAEGQWKWVTGPEKGTLFWQGAVNGSRVNGAYSNWSSGEPNDSNGEDYGHINQNPNKRQKSWNDLGNAGDGPNSKYYRAQGFVVEFGGMPGEPEVKLSAIARIEVSKIAFSDERNFEICLGEQQKLNVEADDIYSYVWTAEKDISSTIVSNPIVSPKITSIYHVTGKLGSCESSADFAVSVNPTPIHAWDSVNFVCEGASINLNPGVHSSYLWENMDTVSTIQVSNEGWYSVELTNEFACVKNDSTLVKLSILPELDYGDLDTLVCGSLQQKLNFSFESGNASVYLFSLNTKAIVVNENSLSPTVNVDEFGIYSFKMKVMDQYQCEFLDTLNIEFHNQPEAKLFLNEEKCKGYSLDLSFTGITKESAIFTWFISDSVFIQDEDLQDVTMPLGYGVRNRTVGLKVNEQGCVDSVKIPVTVTPKMEFWVEENPQGCTPLNVKFGNSDVEEIDSYNWSFGDGGSALVEKPEHTFTNSGVEDIAFDVKLTVVSVEGCENAGLLNKAVIVHPKPTIGFNFDEGVCYTENATVFYSGSGNENDTYYWNLSGFKANEILKNPENLQGPLEFIRSSEPTVQIGLKMISEFGCVSDSISKIFTRKPFYTIELDKNEGCLPLGVEFNATTLDLVDEVNYSWDFGDGNFGTGGNVSNEFLGDDKKYKIKVIAKSSLTACTDTSVFNDGVFVYPQPKASFVANPSSVIISNPVISFENSSENATFYEWDFDDNSAFSEEQSPGRWFDEMGFYKVKLSASNDFGCVDTTVREVSVAFDKVFPPTAFSPNATLEEDREFRIYSKGIVNEGYQLLIFNRWGEVVFESKSQETGWDGKMKNDNFAPSGVYSWVIQFLDFRGEKYKQQGTVTLLF